MAEQPVGDKTEKATAKRREDAKDEGNVARSRELNSAVITITGVMLLQFISVDMIQNLTGMYKSTYIQLSFIEITPATFPGQVRMVFSLLGRTVGPIFLVIIFMGLAVNIAQVGFIFSKKALKPKWSKISPLSGIKRIFSKTSVVEFIKGIFKIGIVASIAFYVIKSHLVEFWMLSNATTSQALQFLGGMLYELAIKTGIALLFLAMADFAFQRWDHEKKLKMTKQEVKDEFKQHEGNPEIKGRIRAIQMQMSRARMMQAVPDATVVVTNPTFIAIAMKYDPEEKSDAPVIIAKGKRKIAQKIKALAMDNDVPVVENKPLARGLFDTVEVGMEVPIIYYQAVAEILAHVFSQRQNTQKANSYA